MDYLGCRDFLKMGHNIPLADVRSPLEYEKGHITGAVNLPLFTDEERALVGTTYKHQGRHSAIEEGLQIAGPKLSEIAGKAKATAKDKKIGLYCWRGGMRSEKMAWLLELIGLEPYVLQGGYKHYRNTLMAAFSEIKDLVVLQGATGSGKTDILHELEKQGEQIIDLELLANHKGSAFGHIGMGEQPTSQQFQNNLFHALMQLDAQRRIWVEGESLTIGRVYLPETLWDQMNRSRVIEIVVPKELRASRLVEDYGRHDIHALAQAIEKITDRFGGNRVKTALNYLESGNLYETALLLLDYYDKSYKHSRKKHKDPSLVQIVATESGSPDKNACLLLETMVNIKL